MAHKLLGAGAKGIPVMGPSPTTIAPGANHNVVKSDGTSWSSSPLGAADVLSEVFIDYVPKTVLPTVTDDAAAHAITDVKGISAAGLGITSQNDVQTVTMTATGGSWAIAYKGQVTNAGAGRAFNVSTAQLQTDIQALSTVGAGSITVTGTAGSSYVLTASGSFAATLLDDFEVVNGGGGATPNPVLTGGTAVIAHTRYGGHRLVNTDVTSTSATHTSIYRTETLANTASWLGIEFDWGATGTPSNLSPVTVIAWAAPLPTSAGVIAGTVSDSPCHCDFFLNSLQYGIIQNGVVVVLFSYTYDTAYAAAAYQFAEVGVDKAQAISVLRAPDGTVWGISHAVISATTARYVTVETFSNDATVDSRPQIARFAADSTPVRINSSAGVSRGQSLITDGRAAARNYQDISTLQWVDRYVTGRRAVLNLGIFPANPATTNMSGVTSTMYVPARSGVILNKIGVLTSPVTVGNTLTETQIIAATNGVTWPDELAIGGAGATLRYQIRGLMQWQAGSGIVTWRVYLGATVAAQTFVMPTQATVQNTNAPFMLEILATVRSTGAGGTYIAGGYGLVWPTSTSVVHITASPVANLGTTTAVDTTAQAAGPKLTVQWGTGPVVANTLTATVGTIERSV
jgi:hypothetical protein